MPHYPQELSEPLRLDIPFLRLSPGDNCWLCQLTHVHSKAVVHAVVVGFGSDGSASAGVCPVCATCAAQHNVVPLVALDDEKSSSEQELVLPINPEEV